MWVLELVKPFINFSFILPPADWTKPNNSIPPILVHQSSWGKNPESSKGPLHNNKTRYTVKQTILDKDWHCWL